MTQAIPSPFVFISYSRADTDLVRRLSDDLHAQGIKTWIDSESLEPGTPDWEDSLRKAIRAAQAVLLIASPAARGSRYVKDELRIAEIFQRPVYPIWITGTQWIDAIPLGWGGTQYIDAREARYSAAVREIVVVLQRRLNTGVTPPVRRIAEPKLEPRNPYKGLQAFTINDAHDFFGRDRLVDEMADVLENLVEAEVKGKQSNRLLAVVGPSGSGKSSVVMAGLLPYLQSGGIAGSKEWIYFTPIVPGTHPIESLTVALARHLSNQSMKVILDDLRGDSLRGLHLYASLLVKQQGMKVVLVIDQFEELFTQTTSEEERRHFIDLLMTALTEPHGPTIILLTLRADFYDRPMLYPEFGKLLQEQHSPVLVMDMKELRSAIEKPASLPDVQLTFEGDLVGDLLFELQGQAGALPLLQFTLDQLYQQRQGHLLTQKAYRKIGGVKGALAKHAESIYASLPTETHRYLARVLFLRLIDLGTTEQDTTRRRAPLTELSLPDLDQTALLRETATAFITGRLLTTNTIAGVATLEVSHEALIREWARLADWLATNRSDILLQRDLGSDVAEWLRRNCPADRLYRGSQLVEAQAWERRNVPSKDEVAFLQASEAEREQQETAERERQARELELQRRAALRQRYIIVLMAVTSVIVVVALIVGLVLQAQLLNSRPVNVTNLNDSGSGSLRDAIQSASPGDTITFAKNLSGTIFLTHGELELSRNITLSGPSEKNVTLDAGHMSRIFQIDNGVIAVISNLTMMNGSTKPDSKTIYSGYGGGIYANDNSTLVLIHCQVIHNKAESGGSAIFSTGELSISTSVISSNTISRSLASYSSNTLTLSAHQPSGNLSGGGPGGGSIYSYGALSISNSRIENNTASGNLGGVGGINSFGTFTLINSQVLNNTGIGASGGISIFSGASITNCIIAGNKADNGSGGISSSGTLSINNSTIENNISITKTARQNGNPLALNDTMPLNSHSGGGGPLLYGGGISNYGSLTLGNSTVSGNKTGINGGGIDNAGNSYITYSTIYNNSAMKGGGIANEGSANNTNNYDEILTSIIAGDQAANSPDIAGAVTLFYPNLIQNPSGATISYYQTNDPSINQLTHRLITGTSPQLAPLQTDPPGSNTPPTHALLPNSPAIDQVPPGDYCGSKNYSLVSFDERGTSRPQGKGCDLGAYEYVPTT